MVLLVVAVVFAAAQCNRGKDLVVDGYPCVPLTLADALHLTTNPDTGERLTTGEVQAAAAIDSGETVPSDTRVNAGAKLWYISILVGSSGWVDLAHADLSLGDPRGPGLYLALSPSDEFGTGFGYSEPAMAAFRVSKDHPAVSAAHKCVLQR